MSNAEISELARCPFCGTQPELIDDRLVFYVRCTGCSPAKCVIYGDNYRHIDHIEDEKEAKAAIAAVDWDAAKQSAVDNWNRRAGLETVGYVTPRGFYATKLEAVQNGEQSVEPVYRVKK